MTRLRYLSTLAYSDAWLDRLRSALPDVDVRQVTATTVDDVPDEEWAAVDVLHTSSVFPDPARTPALKWVQLDTSGVDHVRREALWDSEIPVSTIGGISPVPLAEYVLFTLLGFAHRLPAMLDVQRTRDWPDPDERWRRFLPAPLAGATVTVVGYGRIGREIGRLASGHGMRVIGVSRTGGVASTAEAQANFAPGAGAPAPAEVVGPDRLAEAVAAADYVVVVVPLTEQTAGLVSPEVIAAMKPGVVVINVARGGIVDEAALLDAVRSGQVAGAALDVFDDEPLAADSPWWSEPNVFVTPHVSGLAPLYEEQVLELVIANVRRHQGGEQLLNLVDRSRGY